MANTEQYKNRNPFFRETKKRSYIKKIIKKRNSMVDQSLYKGSRNNSQGSINSMKSIQYDITTINSKLGTVKKETKLDGDMNIDKSYTPSQRMIAHSSIDRIHSSMGSHHQNTKTKLLSTFLDLNKIECIKTMNTNLDNFKIYL
jgi:hypothetical protein